MSTLRVTTLATQAGVEVYTAKAWVNFNGTGTVAIRASGNVSSITDNGTGDYTVNFTVAMVDANFSAVVGARFNSTIVRFSGPVTYATGSVRLLMQDAGGSAYDADFVSSAVFR